MSWFSRTVERASDAAASRTTQNVAAGGLVSVGTVAAVLAFLRRMWPDVIPWDESQDVVVDTFVATFLAPVVSRAIAGWRNPEKGL